MERNDQRSDTTSNPGKEREKEREREWRQPSIPTERTHTQSDSNVPILFQWNAHGGTSTHPLYFTFSHFFSLFLSLSLFLCLCPCHRRKRNRLGALTLEGILVFFSPVVCALCFPPQIHISMFCIHTRISLSFLCFSMALLGRTTRFELYLFLMFSSLSLLPLFSVGQWFHFWIPWSCDASLRIESEIRFFLSTSSSLSLFID